jgi:2-methylcitrate dehydratase PrpD
MSEVDQQSKDTDYTKSLAQYIAGFSYAEMPPEVVARAKLILLDTLGAILPATDPRYPGSKALIDMVRILGGEPQSTIIGFDLKTSTINASLVNGTFGYAYDIEPHHVAAILHPAAVCIPVALAFSEWEMRTGKELLAALTLGIEISCRVSMALNPRDLYGRGFHPTAIACTFGAAATAGHLLKLNTAQWLNALGLSGNQASGLLAWAKDHTENSRPFNPGIAARNGATAALLAKLGFGGPPNIFDGKYDFFSAFSSGGQNPGHFFRKEWAVEELAIKQYSSCSFTHPGLDALLQIIEENGLRSIDIATIDLKYPRAGAHMIDNNELRSHCAQYVFAVAAVTGQVLFDDILTDRRDHPEIKRLYDNSTLTPDDILDRTYPDQYESIVTVTTIAGRKFEKHSGWAKGTIQNPMTDGEIEDKFFKLSARRISEKQAEQIRSWITICETQTDVKELLTMLMVL